MLMVNVIIDFEDLLIKLFCKLCVPSLVIMRYIVNFLRKIILTLFSGFLAYSSTLIVLIFHRVLRQNLLLKVCL